MGFGFGKKRKLRSVGGSSVRAVGNGVEPIDKAIIGSDGTKGMVGRRVKPIDKGKRNIFDPMS
jgi:hypothetical protein